MRQLSGYVNMARITHGNWPLLYVLLKKTDSEFGGHFCTFLSDTFPFRVSLVVTEIFDAGLIGEQTLSTIHHAWKHLLRTSDTAVKVCFLNGL